MRRRRARRQEAARQTGLLVIGAILVLGLPAVVAAAQSWTISTAPAQVEMGVATDVTVTIANTSGNNGGSESIGCVRISIPSEFAVGTASVTSVTNGLSWSVSTSSSGSTIVEATAGGDSDRLRGDPDLDVLVLTVTVTGTSPGSHVWTADEYEKPDCSQNHDQPVSLSMDIGTGANDPPIAADDASSGLHDRVLTIGAPGVLGNDSDPDFDTLSAVLDSTTSNGSLSLAADGSYDYTPDPGYVGTDAFTYHADDGTAVSGTATVTIDVTDAAPVANDDAYTVDKNASLSVGAGSGVMANDSDPDPGESLAASVVSGTTDGTLSLNGDGSFDYSPDAGFSGTDAFTYRVSDGALTSTATVTIDVVNHAPSAADDLYAGPKNLPLSVNAASGVLSNDLDPDGDPLTASVTSGPSSGILLLAANGGFTYTPIVGFDGTDQFTYEATDGSVAVTATVTIAIANTAPVAMDDTTSAIHDRDLVVAAPGVLGNDSDGNGDALAVTLVTGPASGTVTLDPDGGYTYTPVTGFTGTDTFTYRADDGAATSGVATVTIDVTNASPTAVDDGYAGPKGQPLVADVASGVLANDGDADNDTLLAAVTTPPVNGTIALSADGSFTYTPAPGFIGTDTFDYTASDGIATAMATVTITISNAAPVSADDSYSVFRNQALTVAPTGVLADDTDSDGDPLTAILLVSPAHGTLALGAGGGFTFTPDAGYVGPDAFAYRASDGTDTSGPATVHIDVKDRKPAAADDTATVAANGLIVKPAPGLLGNDVDPDGDSLVALLGTGAAHGTAIVQADGGWSYAPDPGHSGSDTFTYVAFDGLMSSAPATVHLTVRAPAPTLAATPEPTAQPTPTPVVVPVASAPPVSPSPSVTPAASASSSPTASPTPSSPPSPSASPIPVESPPDGPSGEEAFSIPDPVAGAGGSDDLGLAAAALGGFGSMLWAVPGLILSVPGLLLIVAILAQAAGGLAWLPIVRRKLGTFGLRAARQANASTRS
jgi:hypothetical protein